MQKLSQSSKTENILRTVIAIIGILTFNISTSYGWGFILGALISKENIHLKSKEGIGMLTLITSVMLVAIYLLLDFSAIYGYLTSTVLYFALRALFNYFQIEQNKY